MEEFFYYFSEIDGKAVYDIIADVLIPFLLINALITFVATQVLKKIFQYFRSKLKWRWVTWRLYPILSVLCGIGVVGASFWVYASSASLWFILTFGTIIGLLAIGFFDHFEVLLNKWPFWQRLWIWLWNKIGLEEVVPESDVMAKRWKKLREKECHLKEWEARLKAEEALLASLEKKFKK